jgi:hypothetical protein
MSGFIIHDFNNDSLRNLRIHFVATSPEFSQQHPFQKSSRFQAAGRQIRPEREEAFQQALDPGERKARKPRCV